LDVASIWYTWLEFLSMSSGRRFEVSPNWNTSATGFFFS
jgi:hypothetical protein